VSWLNALTGSEFLVVAGAVGVTVSILLFAVLFTLLLAYWWATEGDDDAALSKLQPGDPLVRDGHGPEDAGRSDAGG